MSCYRVIFRNQETRVTEAAEIQCDSDNQAIAEARKKADGRTVVIWQDDRWVGTFELLCQNH